MNIEEIKQKIKIARDTKSGVVLENIFPETPSWQSFINHIDFEYNKVENDYINGETDLYDEIFHNGVVFYKKRPLYMSARLNNLKFFKEAEPVADILRKIVGDEKACFNQVFINFVNDESKVRMHLDKRETIFWCCQGSVTWILADPDDWNKTTRYELKAGDAMFAAFGLPHTVETNSPRAGMVFSAFNEN